MLAQAARLHVEQGGAEIIDINMGCPAKKVCKKAAGSALLKDPELVARLCEAVVSAVDVPVTLKIRTGWDPDSRNGVDIARIAEACGIRALAVHGRTRCCMFNGAAEYDTLAAICSAVAIPVIANGDIDSAAKAQQVLDYTGAAGVMLGRAAQGRPWLFREVAHYLAHAELLPPPPWHELRAIIIGHVSELHRFYGFPMGVRIARKHVGWYLQHRSKQSGLRRAFNALEGAGEQFDWLNNYFDRMTQEQEATV